MRQTSSLERNNLAMADDTPKRPKKRGRKPKSTSTSPTPENPTSTGTGNITIPKVTDFKSNPNIDLKGNSSISYNGDIPTIDFKLDNFGGLPVVDNEFIGKQIKYEPFQTVDDITNPSGLKTVDESTFNKAKLTYEGAIRYRQLEQQHSKYVAESFRSMSEAFKSLQAGFGTRIEYEKTKQQFIDVCKAEKVTEDKIIAYVDQAHKTALNRAKLPYIVAEREASLTEVRSKARKAIAKSEESEKDTMNFLEGLNKDNKADSK